MPVPLERGQHPRRQLDVQANAFRLVATREDAAALVAGGQRGPVGVRDAQGEARHPRPERLVEPVSSVSTPWPVRAEIATPSKRASSAPGRGRLEPVHLVEGHHHGPPHELELAQERLHRLDLVVEAGMARVHHVDQHVGLGQLLQRGLERGHELGRQLADEADRVGQDERGVGRGRHQARGRIERDEELVGREPIGPGQAIEQGGLARVGVAHEGDHRHVRCLAPIAQQAPVHAHPLQLVADLLDAVPDDAPVGLDLHLARPPRADPAAGALQVLPLPHEARQQVGELGQLHLELALHGAGPLGEDVEDERGAVDHPHAERAAEVALLDGRERVVGDHEVGALALRERLDLLDLPLAEVEAGGRGPPVLGRPPHHEGAGRLGEPPELVETLLHHHPRLRGTPQGRQHRLLA